jgi:hypothetical protein
MTLRLTLVFVCFLLACNPDTNFGCKNPTTNSGWSVLHPTIVGYQPTLKDGLFCAIFWWCSMNALSKGSWFSSRSKPITLGKLI